MIKFSFVFLLSALLAMVSGGFLVDRLPVGGEPQRMAQANPCNVNPKLCR